MINLGWGGVGGSGLVGSWQCISMQVICINLNDDFYLSRYM